MITEMFLHQLRSFEIFHWAAADTQRSLLDLRLLEAVIISFALATFSTRLFSLHQPTSCSTSLLYTESSFPLISPASVVSSTDVRFPSYLDTQLCINSVNNSVV